MQSTNARIELVPDVSAALLRRTGRLVPGRNRASHPANRTTVVNRDLMRYYELLNRATRALRSRLSREEQMLVCDALNGAWMQQYVPGIVAMTVEDSPPDTIAAPLMATLRNLTPTEELALIDAVEAYWVAGDPGADVL